MQINRTRKKLTNGGNGWDVRKEINEAMKRGVITRNKNGNGNLKLDSTADNIEGIGESSSHACACRIKAKKTTAMEKPAICINKSHEMNYEN